MNYETFNNWRLFPRGLILLYSWLLYEVVNWFMLLPEPTNAQAALVSTISAASAGFFLAYVNSGNKK